MPIRKRISEPYSEQVRDVERRVAAKNRGETKPVAPRKPSAAERKDFVEALLEVPIGREIDKGIFFRSFVDVYMQQRFKIWGMDLYIDPAYKFTSDIMVECTGASVVRINTNRRGIRPRLKLKGEPRTWYSQVIHWIDETAYEFGSDG